MKENYEKKILKDCFFYIEKRKKKIFNDSFPND